MIIYKTTNLINRKIYIGMDSKNNSNYLGSGKLINRAIKKYGKENFKKEVLELCTNKNIAEQERYWIKKYNSRNKKLGYNITVGGIGALGNKMSKKIRQQMSERMKKNPVKHWLGKKIPQWLISKRAKPRVGRAVPENTRKALLKANIGKPCLQEKRDKISKSNSIYWTAYWKKHIRPKTTCILISKALKGKKKSIPHKQNTANGIKLWWIKNRNKILKSQRKRWRNYYRRKKNAKR